MTGYDDMMYWSMALGRMGDDLDDEVPMYRFARNVRGMTCRYSFPWRDDGLYKIILDTQLVGVPFMAPGAERWGHTRSGGMCPYPLAP